MGDGEGRDRGERWVREREEEEIGSERGGERGEREWE